MIQINDLQVYQKKEYKSLKKNLHDLKIFVTKLLTENEAI